MKGVMSSKPAILSILFLGVVAISSAATLIRLTPVPPLTIAAYRMLFSALFLWVFVFPFVRKTDLKVNWKRIIAAGVFLALHFALWISSLQTTSVASSLVLVTMNPIVVAVGSTVFLHEKPSKMLMMSTFISIIGCVLLLVGESTDNISSLQGNFLALGGAVAMSSYLLVGRRSQLDTSFVIYITLVYSVATIVLLFICMISGSELVRIPVESWKLLVALAIVPQIIGHSSINWTLRHLHASYLALVILLEPLLGSFLAYIVLGEGVSKWTLIGGTLIVVSVLALFQRELA